MKLHPEDPRLSDFALGELSPQDATAVAQATASDPALQQELQEMAAIHQFLTKRLTLPAGQLLPHQRENIRRRAREVDGSPKIFKFAAARELFKAWRVPAAVAAGLAITAWLLTRPPAVNSQQIASDPPAAAPAILATSQVVPLPLVAPESEPQPEPLPESPALIQHGLIVAAEFPILDLPVIPGKNNLASISKLIRDQKQLPPQDSVRLEEILNSFPLRLNGVSAIARSAASSWHPDTRDLGMNQTVATLSAEMIACPWQPSAMLLLISIHGSPENDCTVKIAFHANLENVSRYRVLGFNDTSIPVAEKLPATLSATTSCTLALQIEVSKPGGQLGSLQWSSDNKPAPSISLSHKKDAEPSDDARFAALICTYGQWLAGQHVGIIDPEMIAALAREIAAANLPADRADFLSLIDKSLHL